MWIQASRFINRLGKVEATRIDKLNVEIQFRIAVTSRTKITFKGYLQSLKFRVSGGGTVLVVRRKDPGFRGMKWSIMPE